MKKIPRIIYNIIENSASEEGSGANQSKVVFLLFAAIAFAMSVLNAITHKGLLLIATCVFCILCLINWLLVKSSEKNTRLATTIFAIEMGILFTYFVVTGGTDNFSIIWLLMLPSLGLFFFGPKGGTALSAAMFVIMVLCFRLPALQDIVTDYNNTFRTRFPMVYIACFAIAFFLEAVRRFTANSLKEAREKYEYLYSHDALTGVRSRYSSVDLYRELCQTSGTIGLAMFDIDHFRDFNTIYGHAGGDKVLVHIANTLVDISAKAGGVVYRWGGEEFLIFYNNGALAADNAWEINKSVESTPFEIDGVERHVTISGGVYEIGGLTAHRKGFATVVEAADENLYAAKNSGRNKIVVTREKDA